MIEAVGIHKSFGALTVLDDVSLTVPESTVACVIGPSGSGKSTLLRCVNRLERIDAGRIVVDGELVGYEWRGDRLYERPRRAVARQRIRTGMVFQNFRLFPHMTVLDNITEAPRALLGLKRAAAEQRARDLLARVGLAGKETSRPHQLSGGEQQRAAIARALAMEPRAMLFDEPTSALDPELTGGVLKVIRELADGGMTMIVVTHEMPFAREIADQVVFMDNGRVVEAGPPEEVFDAPRNDRTARFLARH
ncbi:amino acid ABC transporter ATP-binding protein [Streptomyces spinoverrucosus]|uniref:amino acid ABC transporter ATP-binding protein n=1 Tax=Streptomyces spinoverrucosus TaxID=284043 RepID=UPI0018C3D800|nr:amino acid ABC transporter ATP-binding protein [Streptomyces spinoverrucosus]MBG0851931.1 amino acid ABC transporter ATP-binding protein [Streptomyces spinoverrucosus]